MGDPFKPTKALSTSVYRGFVLDSSGFSFDPPWVVLTSADNRPPAAVSAFQKDSFSPCSEMEVLENEMECWGNECDGTNKRGNYQICRAVRTQFIKQFCPLL